MPAFSRIHREHILQALERIDSGVPHAFGTVTQYLLVHKGTTYLPKAVVGVAYTIATGESVGPSDFYSGYGQAFSVLQRHGFHVLPRLQSDEGATWWSFATGTEGEQWPRFLAEGFIAHRGGELGDLRQYGTVHAIEAALNAQNPGDSRHSNGARGCWDWTHEVRIGDFVMAKQGLSRLQGVGRVTSDYSFLPDHADPFRHRRSVDWLWAGDVEVPADEQFARKVLTRVDHRPELLDLARARVTQNGFKFGPAPAPLLVVGGKYARADVRRLLGLPEARGGMWDTGYVRHEDAWYLFPNIGIAGRTGHNYGNAWEGDRLRWFAKTGTTIDQPEMKAMLSGEADVHLFTRTADRDPFTYEGQVSPAAVVGGTPVEVLWALHSRAPESAHVPPLAEELEDDATFTEGAKLRVVVNAYERNGAARRACLARYGTICAVCDRTMEDIYGPQVAGLVHVHHLRSIADIGQEYEVNPTEDLRPVCPNCHAVIHWADGDPFTIEEVRAMLARRHSDDGLGIGGA